MIQFSKTLFYSKCSHNHFTNIKTTDDNLIHRGCFHNTHSYLTSQERGKLWNSTIDLILVWGQRHLVSYRGSFSPPSKLQLVCIGSGHCRSNSKVVEREGFSFVAANINGYKQVSLSREVNANGAAKTKELKPSFNPIPFSIAIIRGSLSLYGTPAPAACMRRSSSTARLCEHAESRSATSGIRPISSFTVASSVPNFLIANKRKLRGMHILFSHIACKIGILLSDSPCKCS
mmetsp:Transcript_22540/g.33794  ORF Transcript_22540/g.33794 Transcript_22540/m.33794 type:complete len:232 (+) Transcript_22540:443-1138(+)